MSENIRRGSGRAEGDGSPKIEGATPPTPSAEFYGLFQRAGLDIIALKKRDAHAWNSNKRIRVKTGKQPQLDGWRISNGLTEDQARHWASTNGSRRR